MVFCINVVAFVMTLLVNKFTRNGIPTYDYTKYDMQCHQFLVSCSELIVKRGIVSPTLNVNPPLFVIPCGFFGGLSIYTIAITITHEEIFHPRQYLITC